MLLVSESTKIVFALLALFLAIAGFLYYLRIQEIRRNNGFLDFDEEDDYMKDDWEDYDFDDIVDDEDLKPKDDRKIK